MKVVAKELSKDIQKVLPMDKNLDMLVHKTVDLMEYLMVYWSVVAMDSFEVDLMVDL
jgi:hypothetical protein